LCLKYSILIAIPFAPLPPSLRLYLGVWRGGEGKEGLWGAGNM